MEYIRKKKKKSLLQTENVANIAVPPPLHLIILELACNSKWFIFREKHNEVSAETLDITMAIISFQDFSFSHRTRRPLQALFLW